MSRTLRPSFSIFLVLSSAGLVASCGDPNAGALFADVQYTARCDETPHCTMPQDRDVCGINQGDPCDTGAPEANVSCTVVESDDGSRRTISFSVSQGGGFSLGVRQAVVAVADGATPASGPNCTVTLREGPNTYVGDCGPAPPTEAQPCRVDDVRFYDDNGNPTVEGTIFCQFLENQTNPSLHREVTATGAGAPAFSSTGENICDTYGSAPPPACQGGRFRVANCTGLELPSEG